MLKAGHGRPFMAHLVLHCPWQTWKDRQAMGYFLYMLWGVQAMRLSNFDNVGYKLAS